MSSSQPKRLSGISCKRLLLSPRFVRERSPAFCRGDSAVLMTSVAALRNQVQVVFHRSQEPSINMRLDLVVLSAE